MRWHQAVAKKFAARYSDEERSGVTYCLTNGHRHGVNVCCEAGRGPRRREQSGAPQGVPD